MRHTEWVNRYVSHLYNELIPETEQEYRESRGIPPAKEVPFIVSSRGYSPYTPHEMQLEATYKKSEEDSLHRIHWANEGQAVLNATIAMLTRGMSVEDVQDYLREEQRWPVVAVVMGREALEQELDRRYEEEGNHCGYYDYMTPNGFLMHIEVGLHRAEKWLDD